MAFAKIIHFILYFNPPAVIICNSRNFSFLPPLVHLSNHQEIVVRAISSRELSYDSFGSRSIVILETVFIWELAGCLRKIFVSLSFEKLGELSSLCTVVLLTCPSKCPLLAKQIECCPFALNGK